MDITIAGSEIILTSGYNRKIEANIQGCELSDILDSIEILDIVKEIGIEKLLDEIGEDEAMKHFGLVQPSAL